MESDLEAISVPWRHSPGQGLTAVFAVEVSLSLRRVALHIYVVAGAGGGGNLACPAAVDFFFLLLVLHSNRDIGKGREVSRRAVKRCTKPCLNKNRDAFNILLFPEIRKHAELRCLAQPPLRPPPAPRATVQRFEFSLEVRFIKLVYF